MFACPVRALGRSSHSLSSSRSLREVSAHSRNVNERNIHFGPRFSWTSKSKLLRITQGCWEINNNSIQFSLFNKTQLHIKKVILGCPRGLKPPVLKLLCTQGFHDKMSKQTYQAKPQNQTSPGHRVTASRCPLVPASHVLESQVPSPKSWVPSPQLVVPLLVTGPAKAHAYYVIPIWNSFVVVFSNVSNVWLFP